MESSEVRVYIVIPARLESSRLKRKLLLDLEGQPLILHTIQRASQVGAHEVIVATDSEEILNVVKGYCSRALLTSAHHKSGSDRVAEVARKLPKNSVIVNLQADEPLISPTVIRTAIDEMLKDKNIDITTTCEKINNIQDVLDPNVVKVVYDRKGFAIYFSRSPIPFPREEVMKYGSLEAALKSNNRLLSIFRKHTGLYVYRQESLLKFSQIGQTTLEKIESLEQLRALEHSMKIKVLEVEGHSIGVDTEEDFKKVVEILKGRFGKL